jgi:Mn2+/Fe2+ NRAMP family transporter
MPGVEGATVMRRILNLIATGLALVLVYVVAIVALPFAALLLVIASISRKLYSDEGENVASTASMIWLFVLMAAGMAINLICLPISLFWYSELGKQPPPRVRLDRKLVREVVHARFAD